MRTGVVALLLVALAASAQADLLCGAFFAAREIAIGNLNWDTAAASSVLINLFGCCRNPTPASTGCNATSGPVCGVNMVDYASECAACSTGVRFSGPCNPPPDIFDCYSIPLTSQASILQRVACLSNELNIIIATVNLSAIAYDPTLPDPNLVATITPCTGTRLLFRTLDGSCNSPIIAYSGMVGMKFTRHDHGYNIPTDIDAAIANGPNPRVVSTLLFRRDTFKPNRANLNGLMFAWLNFFIHDFFLHVSDYQDPIAIPLPSDDPDYPANNPSTTYYMYVPRSIVAGDSTPTAQFLRNRVTAWFDGSNVYGSDVDRHNAIRTFSNGLLLLNGTIPTNAPRLTQHDTRPGAPPLFNMAEVRANQHVGLQAITILFMNEHNNIATKLNALYPGQYDDEYLFGFARNILAAELWKIQTVEVSVQLVDDPAQQAIIASVFTAAYTRAYNPLATHITPEDFISAYRWHAMVPDTLTLRNPSTLKPIGSAFDYFSTFQDTSVIRANGIAPVLAGLGVTPAGWVTLNNVAVGIQHLSHPNLIFDRINPFDEGECEVAPIYDLSAIDIVRERERGLPKIGQYWKNIGLGQYSPKYWMNIAETADQASLLDSLYNNNINNVDFVTGMLGQDSTVLDGLPQVSTAGFIPFVISRAYSDRFFTAAGWNAQSYTPFGLARLFGSGAAGDTGVSMAQIMYENGIFPAGKIPTPATIFKVWPTTA